MRETNRGEKDHAVVSQSSKNVFQGILLVLLGNTVYTSQSLVSMHV